MMKTPGRPAGKILVIGAIVIIVAWLFSFGARIFIELALKNRMLVAVHTADLQTLQYTEQYLENQLAASGQSNAYLSQQLQDSQDQNSAIESQVQQISGTVGTLTQLSQTDPELLEKYSRVYFLNENYVPKSLSSIDTIFLHDQSKPQQFLTQALPFLTNMLIAANNAGIPLQVVSAYRSFGTQSALKSIYIETYGSGANSFSAEQGYSEHQLGTAVDLTTPSTTPLTLKFASSTGYAWLTANAYKYGFELSYPPLNPYYIYEPWHWRFVGVDLATWLHDSNITFYDAPQRTIDQYLVSIFNQN
jgi:LAS superfamily LD-carboxypeptidase LdcB